MSDSHDFNLGRVHGRNGSGWVVNETEAYRQGRIAGAIERQNDLLQEQATRQQERWDEEERAQRLEDERREKAEFEARRETERQEEAERSRQEQLRARALNLVRALERLAPHAKNDSRPFERDAFFFACEQARALASVDHQAAGLLDQAWRAGVRYIGKKSPPRMPAPIAQLGDALLALRRQMAQDGLIVSFDQKYSPSIPGTSNEAKGPGHWHAFYGMHIPAWLENGPGTNFVVKDGGIEIDPGKLRAGLWQLEGNSSGHLATASHLRELAREVDRLGLWDVEPAFLEWSNADTAYPPNGLTTSRLVDLVFSHQQMLRELATSASLEDWLRRWVVVPNEQTAAALEHIDRQAKALDAWVASEDMNWFIPEQHAGSGNTMVTLTHAHQQFRDELGKLERIAGPMRGREIAAVLAGNWGETDVQRVLEKCRALRLRSFDDDIFKAAVGEAYRSNEARWQAVERRFVKHFCPLMGPDPTFTFRKLMICAAAAVGGGVLFIKVGFILAGLALIGAAVLVARISWTSMLNTVGDFSEAYLRRAKQAHSLAPPVSDLEKLKLWRRLNGIDPAAGASSQP